MNEGRTVFAQLLDFLPKYEFDKCVARYHGNFRVRKLPTYEQFLVLAFAQLTWREGLRDIETCLAAFGPKLYHAGMKNGLAELLEQGKSNRHTSIASIPIVLPKDGGAEDWVFDFVPIQPSLRLHPSSGGLESVPSCHGGTATKIMIRSLALTTQGRLHTRDIRPFLMPTLLSDTNLFLWIDLENPTSEETKAILADLFHFHPLSIEDCVGVSPSPKVEEYLPKEEDYFAPYLFIVIHAVDYRRQDGVFGTSELDFVLGKIFLVTYHTVPLRSVALIAERACQGPIPIARAPDRVARNLLDAIVDNYKPALEELSREIAELEQAALQNPAPRTLNQIRQIKKEVRHRRQIIGPQREVLARFARGEFKLIRAHLVPYYRNVYDALYHISELAQNYTDSLTGILQVYLNRPSNQTGKVVKLLTSITVITTPLMMIGTWYGMNFHDKPELNWRHGYWVAGTAMLASTALTCWDFKKRNWF